MVDGLLMNPRGRIQAAPAEKKEQYLAFELGGEAFAMDIRSLREVIQYEGLTPLPLGPDFLKGVLNLRGAVVPVLDLSVRFGRRPTEVAPRTCVVILEAEDRTLGILVDQVSEVLELAPSAILPMPAFGTPLRSEFLLGVAQVGERFVLVLDVAPLLSFEDLAALEGAAVR